MDTNLYRKMFVTRSEVFSWFNQARAAGNRGDLDLPRLNRALGILLSANRREHLESYSTTTTRCGCPDRSKHPKVACKHMLAVWVIKRILETRTAAGVVDLVVALSTRHQWRSGETVWLGESVFVKNFGEVVYLCVAPFEHSNVPVAFLDFADDAVCWTPAHDLAAHVAELVELSELFEEVANA